MKKCIGIGIEVLLFVAVASLITFVFPCFDEKTAGLFQRLLAPLEERNDVVMITVDDTIVSETLSSDRDGYAEMLDVLKDLGAETVVLGVDLSGKSVREIDWQYVDEKLPAAIDMQFAAIGSGIESVFADSARESSDANQLEEAAGYLTTVTQEARNAMAEVFAAAVRDPDAHLADSIRFFGSTYLAFTVDDSLLPNDAEWKSLLRQYAALDAVDGSADTLTRDCTGAVPVSSDFMERADGVGFVHVAVNDNARLRRLPLVLKYDGKYYGHLVLATVLRRLGNPRVVVTDRTITLVGCALPSGEVQDIIVPRDRQGDVIVKYPRSRFDGRNFVSLRDISRLSRLDDELYRTVSVMRERGLFALWDGFDPVELYQSAMNLKQELSTGGERAEDDVTYERYALFRSGFYGTVETFLGSDQEELLVDRYDGAERIHELFAAARECFDEVRTVREVIAEKVKGAMCIVGTDIGGSKVDLRRRSVTGAYYALTNQLLTHDFVDDSPWWVSVALAAVLCVIGSLVALRIRSAGGRLVFGIGAVLVTLGALLVWFLVTGVYVGVLVPAVTLSLSLVVIFLVGNISVATKKRFVTAALSKSLSKEVFGEIAAKSFSVQLDAHSFDMTAVFTGIQQCSALTELLEPEQLAALLDFYFTKMSSIIMAERGTIDRYGGGTITAFVGAPVQLEDHAVRACAVAIKVKQSETDMNADIRKTAAAPKPAGMDDDLYRAFKALADDSREIVTHIGVCSGRMVAGYLGSAGRKSYTMLGDNADIAVRLEAANRLYGTEGIVISEATRLLLGDRFVVRSLDRVLFEGVSAPVRLYELMAETSAADDFLVTYVRYWEQAMRLFEDKEYAKALAYFRKLAEKKDDDSVARHYVRLIEDSFIRGTYPTAGDGGVAYNPEDGVFRLLLA